MNNDLKIRRKEKFDLTFPFSSFSTSPLLSNKILNIVERKEIENDNVKGKGMKEKEGNEGEKRGREEKKGKSTYNRNSVLTNLRISSSENFNSKHSARSTHRNISVRAPLGKNVLSYEHSSIEKIKISREEKKSKKAEEELFENGKLKKKEEKQFLNINGHENDGETKEIEENEDGKEGIVEDEKEKHEKEIDSDIKNLKLFDSNDLKSVNRENTENSCLRKREFRDSYTSAPVISNLNSNVNYLSREEEVEIEVELMKLLLSSSLSKDKNEIINDDIDGFDKSNNENNKSNTYEHNNDCVDYLNKYQKQKGKQNQKLKCSTKISNSNFSKSQEVNRTGLTENSYIKRSSLPSLNVTITPSFSLSLPLPASTSLKKSNFENKRESIFSTTDLQKTRK